MRSSALGFVLFVLLSTAAAAAETRTKQEDDPASWKPEVRSLYETVRSMPGVPKDGVLVMIHKLAAHATDARPAITALAKDRRLPEPHRAWSAILAASYIRYDTRALRTMAHTHRNPYARREAIDLLAQIGGPANKLFLEGLAGKDASLRPFIASAVARMPAVAPISEDDRRLLASILLEPIHRKQTAAVMLFEAHRGRSDMDAELERLAGLTIADSNAQVYAALTLAHIHAKDVAKLKALTAREKNRFIRYHAMQELARNGQAGEAVLSELAAAADEPLKPVIEKWLQGK